LARAAAKIERPLLSVDVSVCLCVCVSTTLMLNISDTKRFMVRVYYGPYRKVHTARRLVTSSITSCDSMASESWRYNFQSGCLRKLQIGSTIRVGPL